MLISQTAVAAGLLAVPLAAAAPQPAKRGLSFKLPLSRRGSSTDSVGLSEIDGDSNWITDITVGGQQLRMQVDTGSSDIWVLSTLMSASQQSQHPQNKYFDPSKSSTWQKIDPSHFNISYSTGDIYAAGIVGNEVVELGAAKVDMELGAATDISATGMVESSYDGLIGLAFGGGNTFMPKRGPTFMEAIQDQLSQPVFAFNIPAGEPSKQSLEFGAIDKSAFKGNLVTAAVNNGTTAMSNGWTGTASLSMNGKNISSQQGVLFDTGGLIGSFEASAVGEFWKQAQNAKDTSTAQDNSGWVAPCNGDGVPDLTYDFVAPDGSRSSATIPGKLLVSTSTYSSDNSLCTGALQGIPAGQENLIGYGFFHAMYTVFDQANAKVSFAPYSDGQGSVSSSDGNSNSNSGDSNLQSAAPAAQSNGPSTSAEGSGNSTSSSTGPTESGGSDNKNSTSAASGTASATASASGNGTASATESAKASAVSGTSAPKASDNAPGGSAGNGGSSTSGGSSTNGGSAAAGSSSSAAAQATNKSSGAGKTAVASSAMLAVVAAVGIFAL